ncbi:MAG: tungsten ABC transporter substrate-binding protein, partial [Deltaproteobacteria bacterium]
AGIRGTKSSSEAFRKIAAKGALFLSRGDKSGTHSKEMGLWKSAGVSGEGKPWYQQTGLGMGQTLSVAAEKKGYTLADRGTYLSMKKSLGIPILAEGDKELLNVYHVIVVNPAKWPKVNADGAKAFTAFLVAADAQKTIGTFGVGKFGAPLFFPDAGKRIEDLGK